MDSVERIAVLAAVFDCPLACAERLDREGVVRRFAGGAHVHHQGDPPPCAWLVLEGAAQAHDIHIDGHMTQLASFEPGEIFGTILPARVSIDADFVAAGDLIVLQFDPSRLERVCRAEPELALGLAHLVAGQLRAVYSRLAARATLTARGRVCAALLRVADADGRIAPLPVVAALAASVQTTRETASRTIGMLVRRGIVRRDDDALTIVARRMLEELVV